MAGAAPELLGEPEGPGPFGDVGKHDSSAVLALVLGYGGLEGGDVRGVQVRVRDREHVQAVPCQTAREVEEQSGHGPRPHGHGSGEPGGEFGGGVGEGREEHGVVAVGGEPRGGCTGHRLRNNDVGCERQVRAVRLDGTDGQNGHRLRAVEVANLLPGQLRKVEHRHGWLYRTGAGG